MEYHQITINEYLDLKQKIADKLAEMASDYITIGYYLKRIRDTEGYKQDGHASIADFAKAEYGLSESATSRFIAINTKFSVDGNTPLLLEEYKNYGSSKLSEMLTMSDEDVKLVKETTTITTIREIKQFNKKNVEDVEDNIPEETTPARVIVLPEDDLGRIIVEFFRNEKELLDTVWSLSSEEDIAEAISPSGNRTYKKGLYMLFIYDYKDGIALKKIGKLVPDTYTWTEFIEAMVRVYKDYYQEGSSIHEAYYGVKEEEKNAQAQVITRPEANFTKTVKVNDEIEEKVTQEATVTENEESRVNNSVSEDFKSEKLEEKTPVAEPSKSENANEQNCIPTRTEQQFESQNFAHSIESAEKIEAEVIEADVVTPQYEQLEVRHINSQYVLADGDKVVVAEECLDDVLMLLMSDISEKIINEGMKCIITFRKE